MRRRTATLAAAAPIAVFLLAFFFPVFPNHPCSALVSCPYGKVVGYESTVMKLTNSDYGAVYWAGHLQGVGRTHLGQAEYDVHWSSRLVATVWL